MLSRLRHIAVAQAHGINLVRLAKLRKPVGFFDTSKLSKDGYLVRVEDQDPKQPGEFLQWNSYGCSVLMLFYSWRGSVVRNGAHLRSKADR